MNTCFIGKPGVPQDFEGFDILTKSLCLRWKAPATDGDTPITAYKIHMKEKSQQDWKTILVRNGAVFKCLIPDLDQGGKYLFRIAAINEIGESDFSEAIETQTQGNDLILK